MITLTESGQALKEEAVLILQKNLNGYPTGNMSFEEMIEFQKFLKK